MTIAEPHVEFLVAVEGQPAVLVLQVISIVNPTRQGFALRTTIVVTTAAGTSRFELGSVSPLPADSPGTFLQPIPRDAAAAIVEAQIPPTVVVDLLPVDTTRPLAPSLEVRFRASIRRG